MSMDSDIAQLIEKASNAYLHLDPDTAADITELQGKVVGFDITTFNKQLFFMPQADGTLSVACEYQGTADTLIKARAIDLFRLAQDDEKAGAVQAEISGDVRLGESFQRIFASIELDLEELLAPWLGDVLAHEIGKGSRILREGLQQCRDGLAESTGEYLLRETKLAVGSEEVQQFVQQVDALRDAVERCETKLAQSAKKD